MKLLNEDLEYLAEKGIQVEMHPGGEVVLKDLPLPSGKFTVEKADILVLLPDNYNDSGPDMFYAHPWLLLNAGGRHPRCADVSHSFNGINWQRWSRHEVRGSWRPGMDSFMTVFQRIQEALRIAAA